MPEIQPHKPDKDLDVSRVEDALWFDARDVTHMSLGLQQASGTWTASALVKAFWSDTMSPRRLTDFGTPVGTSAGGPFAMLELDDLKGKAFVCVQVVTAQAASAKVRVKAYGERHDE